MSNEPRIRELLEDLLESGSSVEETCAADPDLIPIVRERWLRMQNLQAEVNALFPSSGDSATEPALIAAGLPQIPGYEIERELGRGGMGVVYRARHARLQRWVALKMMLTGPFASRVEQQRFQREAELVAQLRHPNIVPTFDVGDVGGTPYYTMELVEGPSLRQRLVDDGPLPVMAAAGLVATLARAIEAVHLQGIVHRDLKPANILLAGDGTPKISDFGLARRVGGEGLTVSGAQVGTPSYMAPEQASGHVSAIGPAVDIYSLGAILYELLTGRPPLEVGALFDGVHQQSSDEPKRPRQWDRRIPRDIETICLCCLRREPHRRYASAALLAADLERFVRGEPIVARSTPIGGRVWKWARRRPGLAAALSISGGLGLLALMLLLTQMADDRARVRDTENDLQRAAAAAMAADWTAARATLAKAEVRLGDRIPSALQTHLATMHREFDLADRLEAIRIRRAMTLQDGKLVREDRDGCDADYAATFEALLPDFTNPDVTTIVATIGTMAIRNAVVAALDDWALQIVGEHADERRRHVLELARLADPDPTGWRDRARDADTWTDLPTLRELAATADVGLQPLQLLMTISARLQAAGGNPFALLDRVVALHPHDFFVNYSVAVMYTQNRPAEAIRYLQSAIALRPDAAMAYAHLGLVMCMSKRFGEAETALSHAIALDDSLVAPRVNLGKCYYLTDRFAKAEELLQQARTSMPKSVSARLGLATVLLDEGKFDAALAELREAERLEPSNAVTQSSLGKLLQLTGKDADAERVLRHALELDPDLANAHYRLANTLQRLHRQEEGIPHYRRAIELAPDDADQHADLAQSLADVGLMEDAIAEWRAAIRLAPKVARMHKGLGVALALDWQLAAALDAFAAAKQLEPTNPLATIGMAQALIVLGRFREACVAARTIGEQAPSPMAAAAAKLFDEGARLQLLADRLPELTASGGDGVTAIDRLRLAEYCVASGNFADGVRWYEWAFAAYPQLAEDVRAGRRFAAIAALKAGAGLDTTVAAADRRGYLQRAATWLRADLTEQGAYWHEVKPAVQRLLVRRTAQWLTEPAFASVRDAGSILDLAPEDRNTWLQFWHDVDVWLAAVKTH